MKRGRPATLDAERIAEVARRRAAGQSYAEISAAVGIPIGTARFASWLARHGRTLRGARLQLPGSGDPTPAPSAAVSGARVRGRP